MTEWKRVMVATKGSLSEKTKHMLQGLEYQIHHNTSQRYRIEICQEEAERHKKYDSEVLFDEGRKEYILVMNEVLNEK